MLRYRTIGILALLSLMLTAPLFAQGGLHVDKKHGFKIKIPGKWATVPVDIDEKWIVANFLSNRTYTASVDGLYPTEHKPAMRIIVFRDEAKKRKGAQVERISGEAISVDYGNNPYQGYEDYLKRHQSGFHFAKDENTKIAGVKVRKLEAKVTRDNNAPIRIITWIFRGVDADYAVEFEMFENRYKKLGNTCKASLKSFRFIARDVGLQASTTGSESSKPGIKKKEKKKGGVGLDFEERIAWRQRTAKDRKEERQVIEDRRTLRFQKNIPKSWKFKKSKNFVIMSHADDKFTAEVVKIAEAGRKWCKKKFSHLNDEYVFKGFIRICANYGEYRLYNRKSADSWNALDREIVVYKDIQAGGKNVNQLLLGSVLRQYLFDKDPFSNRYMPDWFRLGLYQLFESATVSGSSLKLTPSEWEAQQMREIVRADKLRPASELMTVKSTLSINDHYENANLLRYLMKSRKRSKATKNFIVRYIEAIISTAVDIERKNAASKDSEVPVALTEEEEEERYSKTKERIGKQKAKILKNVHEIMGIDRGVILAIDKGYSNASK